MGIRNEYIFDTSVIFRENGINLKHLIQVLWDLEQLFNQLPKKSKPKNGLLHDLL